MQNVKVSTWEHYDVKNDRNRGIFPLKFPPDTSLGHYPRTFPSDISPDISLDISPGHFPRTFPRMFLDIFKWCLGEICHFPQKDFPPDISLGHFPGTFPPDISLGHFPRTFPSDISSNVFGHFSMMSRGNLSSGGSVVGGKCSVLHSFNGNVSAYITSKSVLPSYLLNNKTLFHSSSARVQTFTTNIRNVNYWGKNTKVEVWLKELLWVGGITQLPIKVKKYSKFFGW